MKSIVTCIFAALILASCSSGKKALEKGNYYDAVVKSVNRLRQNSSHKKATSTLKQAYPMAIEYYADLIEQEIQSNNQFKYGIIASYMYTINNLADDISRCPAAKRIIPNAKRYDGELPGIEKNAAEERYMAGIHSLNIETRESGIDAYYHFKKCLSYVSNYKDANERLQEAKEMGTLRVVLEKIPSSKGKYRFTVRFFQNNVESFLNDEFNRNNFIRLYTPAEAEQIELVPDHIIQVEFVDFVVGNTHTREVSKEIIGKDTVEIKRGKTITHGLPKATLNTYSKEVISNGVLQVKVIEYSSGKILLHNTIPGEYKWFTEWATATGDERALTNYQKQLLKQRPSAPPSNQDLFIEFTKPIFTEFQRIMKNFYKNY